MSDEGKLENQVFARVKGSCAYFSTSVYYKGFEEKMVPEQSHSSRRNNHEVAGALGQ